MQTLALWAGLALGIVADAPECRDPPSRASDSYWSYIEACGCARLEPPSKASLDYERFLKACSAWRERNPRVNVIVPDGKPADSTGLTEETSPTEAPECKHPPSRASDSCWPYIEACGCEKLDPPSKASLDYERFMRACSLWRERNPEVDVIAPSSGAKPRPASSPSPKTTPLVPCAC